MLFGKGNLTRLSNLGSTYSPRTKPALNWNWQRTPCPSLLTQLLFTKIVLRIYLRKPTGKLGKTVFDALAWYVSFHVDNPSWGIFIPMSSLLYLGHRYFGHILLSPADKWDLAFSILLEHEAFHFATDYAVAQWELLLDRPCWVEFTKRRIAEGTYLPLEEKLANAYMLRTLESSWRKSISCAVKRFIAIQPPGYSEGAGCVLEESFNSGLVELTKTYVTPYAVEHSLNLTTGLFDFGSLFPLDPQGNRNHCPLHFIHDESRLGIPPLSVHFLKCISKINETERFSKSFATLPATIQNRWQKKKAQLALGIPRHPEFEKLKGSALLFSIRLNDKFRAHLRPIAGSDAWEAVAVGTHRELGHG